MRYYLIILLVCIAAFSAAFNGPAFSQRQDGVCGRTDSTAAVLDCVNKQSKLTQDRLGEVFKGLADRQDDKSKAALAAAQKDWIVYRDAQCKWEAGLSEAPALTRVYELSCLNALTEGRIALLESVRDREQEKGPPEFGAQPRWMNVLAQDYPAIFWRYGESQSADMDCDDENEQIMTGIAVAHVQDSVVVGEGAVEEKTHNEVEIIIAVAENPQTGRPKVKLVRLPVREKGAGGPVHLCRPAAKLEIAEDAAAPEEGAEQPACTRVLKVTDGVCTPLIIRWNGKDYGLKPSGSPGEAL